MPFIVFKGLRLTVSRPKFTRLEDEADIIHTTILWTGGGLLGVEAGIQTATRCGMILFWAVVLTIYGSLRCKHPYAQVSLRIIIWGVHRG